MMEEYYEFKDLRPFLRRFYEIIEGEEKEAFMEDLRVYYSRFKTYDELYEHIISGEEEKYNKFVNEIMEKYKL